MVIKKIRRLAVKLTSDRKLILALTFGVTLLLWDLNRSGYSLMTSGLETLASIKSMTRLAQENMIRDNKQVAQDVKGNINDCSIIDFFATVDASAKTYDKELLCDDKAEKSDIVCRMFLRQIGLEHLEKTTCRLESPGKVPKVVYFVIFGDYIFKFWHYIAIKAARRFIDPSAVYVIGDQHPQGRWWQQVLRDVKGVRFVYREMPANFSGKPISFRHHMSDVVRLQTLYMNGGIYLDADMVVVRNLDPLLDYDITLGMVENGTGMGNAFITVKRGSPFLREWYTQYQDYHRGEFYWNSLQVPRNMWFKNSSRVHIESDKLYRPNWFEADLLFKRSDYPWRNNYAIHVWTNGNPVPRSPADIQTANTTIAQIFRHVMYGDSKPRTKLKGLK